jgi:hypothetical protein
MSAWPDCRKRGYSSRRAGSALNPNELCAEQFCRGSSVSTPHCVSVSIAKFLNRESESLLLRGSQ